MTSLQTRLSFMVLMGCGVLRLLGGTAFPAPAEEAFQRGLNAYGRQDYATALREWQPSAQQGNPAAQVMLGLMYKDGRGVARNDAEAVKWLRKAAAQGDAGVSAGAQVALALMAAEGRGVARNDAEAVKSLQKDSDKLAAAPRAQGDLTVLVTSSDWNIRHGILHERYNFRANGSYDYLHSAGSQPIAVDSGTYTVQGDRLILRPAGGPEKILRWRIGTQGTEYYKQSGVLYLNYPDGREEFYYPNMNR